MHYKGINIFRHKVIFMDFLVFQCIYFQIIKAKVVQVVQKQLFKCHKLNERTQMWVTLKPRETHQL